MSVVARSNGKGGASAMIAETYNYHIEQDVPFDAVEESLILAILAAEGLYGTPQVRLDAECSADIAKRSCVVDAVTEVGRDIARLFTGFLSRQFGEDNFTVERLGGQSTNHFDPNSPKQ